MVWLPGFYLDEESVQNPDIWEAASYEELTDLGIEDFLKLYWEWECWIKELIRRFSYILKHPMQRFSPVDTQYRLKVASRLFEILYEEEVDEKLKLEIALSFDPQRVLEDLFSFPPSSNEEFWGDMLHWAEDIGDKIGFLI